MTSNNKKYTIYAEEKEISSAFESDILAASDDSNIEKVHAMAAAKHFLKKSERINIRMNAFRSY
ncbi:MAG: hypothetical protein COA94_06590 [Rickettsiales bacterium]|nr:MAG: hypothetical protein COA94_06590 [Rickettsiales bacterium]